MHIFSGRVMAALSVVMPTLLWAQVENSQPEVIELPEYLVVGVGGGSITSVNSEIAREQLTRISGGTDLVSADEYLSGRALNLKDVLDFSPGVFVQSRFGAEEARLSIRGSGLQRTFHGRGLRLLQDGLPLNEADGAFDFQALEPLSYDYIEVYRGANALRYGSTTLGGAVNFISPTGYTASPKLRAELGSFETYRAQAVHANTQAKTDWYTSFSHSQTDGYRDYSRQENTRLSANLGYRLSDQAETRFYVNAAVTDSELPGSLTKAQAKDDPKQADPGNVLRRDKRDFEYIRLANNTTLLTETGRFSAGVSYSYKDMDHPIFYLQLPAGGTGPGVIDQITHNMGLTLNYEFQHEVLGRDSTTTVGFMPTYGYAYDTRFENLAGTSRRGQKYADTHLESLNLELYAETEIALNEKLSLFLGAQAVKAERNAKDKFLSDGNDSTLHQSYDTISPKIGLRYDLDKDTNIYANVSRSFEPPSFGEIGSLQSFVLPQPIALNNQLDAQEATTIEIGTRGTREHINWDLSLYHAWIENELLNLNDEFGTPLGTINADETIHAGLEFGLGWRLLERNGYHIILQQLYNWSYFRFDGDEISGNNRLAGMPEHYYRAKLLVQLDNGYYFGPDLEWSPEGYAIDHANTFSTDGYALLGFSAGYKTERGLSWFIQLRNLTDKNYVSTTGVIADAGGADSAQFNPGDGRAIYIGGEFKF